MKSAKTLFCIGLVLRLFVASNAAETEVHEYHLRINSLINANAIIRYEYGPFEAADLCIGAEVKTRGLAQRIFPINNRYQTWIDTTTFLPIRTAKQIDQKNIVVSLAIEYDHERACAGTDRGESWPIIPGCQSLFSLLPYLRHLTIEPQDSLTLGLEIEGHLWWLGGQAIRDKEGLIRLHFEFKAAMPIRPRPWKTDLLHNRISRSDTRLTVWLESGGDRLPLRLLFNNDRFTVDMRLIERRRESTP